MGEMILPFIDSDFFKAGSTIINIFVLDFVFFGVSLE